MTICYCPSVVKCLECADGRLVVYHRSHRIIVHGVTNFNDENCLSL